MENRGCRVYEFASARSAPAAPVEESSDLRARPPRLAVHQTALPWDGSDSRARYPGRLMQQFLKDLIEGAGQRKETLHFVTAREMVNIVLAACAGREGH